MLQYYKWWKGFIRDKLNLLPVYRKTREIQRAMLDDWLHDRLPPKFIVIGVQKGGTTSIYRYLAEHPELAATERKELDFFYCDLMWQSGLKKYRREFPLKNVDNGSRWSFDVSPFYMFAAEKVSGRIKQSYPDIKIIVLLRNPALRAYSAWHMYRKHLRKNYNWYIDKQKSCNGKVYSGNIVKRRGPFGEDFRNDYREDFVAIEKGLDIEMPIIKFGLYEQQLEAYYKHFSSSQILVLESEVFFTQTASVLNQAVNFLEIASYSWPGEKLVPHYQGNYKKKISKEEFQELKIFYDKANRGLEDLVQCSFSWS